MGNGALHSLHDRSIPSNADHSQTDWITEFDCTTAVSSIYQRFRVGWLRALSVALRFIPSVHESRICVDCRGWRRCGLPPDLEFALAPHLGSHHTR